MAIERTRKHVKAETSLSDTSRTETAHSRMKARPNVEDLEDPEEILQDAEVTPARDRASKPPAKGSDHVADAGDVGASHASSYGTPAQADAFTRQTSRAGEPRGVEKPKRG